MRRLTHLVVLVAFIFSCGGQWVVLQGLAWANMVREYSEVVPLQQAVKMTLSGEYPCPLCKAIAEKKQPGILRPGKIRQEVLFCRLRVASSLSNIFRNEVRLSRRISSDPLGGAARAASSSRLGNVSQVRPLLADLIHCGDMPEFRAMSLPTTTMRIIHDSFSDSENCGGGIYGRLRVPHVHNETASPRIRGRPVFPADYFDGRSLCHR